MFETYSFSVPVLLVYVVVYAVIWYVATGISLRVIDRFFADGTTWATGPFIAAIYGSLITLVIGIAHVLLVLL